MSRRRGRPGRPRKFQPGDIAILPSEAVGPEGEVVYWQPVVVYDWRRDYEGKHWNGQYLVQRLGQKPYLYPHGPMIWRRPETLLKMEDSLQWTQRRAPSALKEWRRSGKPHPEAPQVRDPAEPLPWR